jgi:2-polyprenyl-3-methyl-5-hydroxy-6-metoxy-1,4-benzoquinol methylase
VNEAIHDVRPARMIKVLQAQVPAIGDHTPTHLVVVCNDTTDFRRLARSQLNKTDRVIDIGCSYGRGTAVIAEHCASVIGIDISEECVVSFLFFL